MTATFPSYTARRACIRKCAVDIECGSFAVNDQLNDTNCLMYEKHPYQILTTVSSAQQEGRTGMARPSTVIVQSLLLFGLSGDGRQIARRHILNA